MGHDNSGRFLATERRTDAGVGACCGPRSNPGNMLLHPLREERAHRTHGKEDMGRRHGAQNRGTWKDISVLMRGAGMGGVCSLRAVPEVAAQSSLHITSTSLSNKVKGLSGHGC